MAKPTLKTILHAWTPKLPDGLATSSPSEHNTIFRCLGATINDPKIPMSTSKNKQSGEVFRRNSKFYLKKNTTKLHDLTTKPYPYDTFSKKFT